MDDLDEKQSKLTLTRDPIGQKPLYYSILDGKIVSATSIKSLFDLGVPCGVNYDMIPSYLMYQYTLGMNTLFKGVYKLPAGHTLTVSSKEVKSKRYWELSDNGFYLGSRDNPVSHLRCLLEKYIKRIAQPDVPIGSFLSGGVDSSAITALYRKFHKGKLFTFNASFNTHSEATYASLVSEYLGTEHHEIRITADMVRQDIKKITCLYEEPLGDAATINVYYLAREAKKHVDVVLAGEGGDEVFGGYPWHRMAPYISVMNRVPGVLREAGQALVYAVTRGDVTAKSYRLGRIALFPLQLTLPEMQLYLTTAMNWQNVRWLTNFDRYRIAPVIPESVNDPYNQMLAMDCLNKLPEQGNMKAYKATKAWDIEERLPLLDKEVVEYAFTIPPKLKKDKWVLRKAVEDLLPPKIVWRPKQGFGTPLVEWLNSPQLKEMVVNRLRNGELLREICREDALDKLVRLVEDGRLKRTGVMMLNPANVVWSLFALQIWWDVWFEGKHLGSKH